jgi:hypothetical protein
MNLMKRVKPVVAVLGCEHRVQIVETEADPSFRHLVEAVIEQHGVRFIGEEAEQGKRSIAKDIAASRKLRYRNIDIPQAVQSEIRLPPHMKFNGTTGLVEVVVNSDKYALAWNLVREHHMYKTFLEEIRAVEPSLLICGRSHMTGFAGLLGERYTVIPISFEGTLEAGCATAS